MATLIRVSVVSWLYFLSQYVMLHKIGGCRQACRGPRGCLLVLPGCGCCPPDEKILFDNGSRILFGARESGFGRGFSDVDVLAEQGCAAGTAVAVGASGWPSSRSL